MAETRDPNGRKLAFAWRLLQGDPRHVTIEPLDKAGSRARITLDWTGPFPISKENPIRSARVDVGVFANNGVHDSAPAILSWYMPPSETRLIETGPDGAPRTARIDHADPAKAATYADPMLVPRADWSDHFTYGEDGALTGWLRSRDGAPDETLRPRRPAPVRGGRRGASGRSRRLSARARRRRAPRGTRGRRGGVSPPAMPGRGGRPPWTPPAPPL